MSKAVLQKLLLIFFLFVICIGTWKLANYSSRPGAARDATESETAKLSECLKHLHAELKFTDADKSTLIVFYHPHCPCTTATFRALEKISPCLSVRPNFIAVAFCPTDESDAWINSASTSIAREIAGRRVVVDRGASLCQRFGVRTSGHILFCDSGGSLIFDGGITSLRGHEGDCQASSSLLRTINGLDLAYSQWPVFGCPLFVSEDS